MNVTINTANLLFLSQGGGFVLHELSKNDAKSVITPSGLGVGNNAKAIEKNTLLGLRKVTAKQDSFHPN